MDVEGCLVIKDAHGIPRIVLSADERSPRIILAGKDRSELVLEMEDDSARVRFRRRTGVDSVVMSSKDDVVSIVMFDESGKTTCILSINNAHREGHVVILDEFREERFRIELPPK